MEAQIKPGYKQTEVGVIPVDWSPFGITQITKEIFLGLTSKVDYVELNGVPLVRASDIAKGYLNFDNVRTISIKQHKELTKYRKAERGDILVSKSGSLGVCAIVETDREFSIYESVITIKPKNILNSRFLLCLMRDETTQMRMLGAKVGSSVSHLNLEIFRRLVVPLPSTLAEQERIARALSDVDGLIEGLQKLIDKKRLMKQGAMQRLLNPYENGQLKLGWEVKQLGDITDIRNGGTPSTLILDYWNGDIYWCTPTDITALTNKYLSKTFRTITYKGLQNSSAEMIPSNSIVMTSRATIGECAINTIAVCTNQGFKNFIPFDCVDVEFLYYLLLTKKQTFIALCSGSTFLEISKTQVANVSVEIPTNRVEQEAIASTLSDMDAEIEALEQKLAKYRQVKQGMMQELLTGKTRLVQPTQGS